MRTFIIRNKSTLEQWTADSGKSSWRKPDVLFLWLDLIYWRKGNENSKK